MTLHFGSSLSRQETPPGGTLQRTLLISCYLASQHSSQGPCSHALVRPTRHNSRLSLKPKVSFLKFRVFESQISETSSAFLVFVHTALLLYGGSTHCFSASLSQKLWTEMRSGSRKAHATLQHWVKYIPGGKEKRYT